MVAPNAQKYSDLVWTSIMFNHCETVANNLKNTFRQKQHGKISECFQTNREMAFDSVEHFQKARTSKKVIKVSANIETNLA